MIILTPSMMQQVGNVFMQAVINAAQALGGDAAANQMKRFFRQNAIQNAVGGAIDRAYVRFQQEAHDAALLAALDLNHAFLSNATVLDLLGQVATLPSHYDVYIKQLAACMHQFAPHVPEHRREAAAQTLVRLIHDEIAHVPQLQKGLEVMHGRLIVNAIQKGTNQPGPDFAPNLRESVLRGAEAVATELQQGYVTPSHLLYALVVLPDGISAGILAQLSVTSDDVRRALHHRIKPYAGPLHMPHTPGVDMALASARQLALLRGLNETHDDHIFGALLDQVEQGGEGSTTLKAVLDYLHLSSHDLRALLEKAQQVDSVIFFLSNI